MEETPALRCPHECVHAEAGSRTQGLAPMRPLSGRTPEVVVAIGKSFPLFYPDHLLAL
jgi:hypothetical protein